MKIKYDVSIPMKCQSQRFINLKEAFEIAKEIAKREPKEIVMLTKIIWNNDGGIKEYKSCIVKSNGTFEYL